MYLPVTNTPMAMPYNVESYCFQDNVMFTYTMTIIGKFTMPRTLLNYIDCVYFHGHVI